LIGKKAVSQLVGKNAIGVGRLGWSAPQTSRCRGTNSIKKKKKQQNQLARTCLNVRGGPAKKNKKVNFLRVMGKANFC
jgi:hypothetical protein